MVGRPVDSPPAPVTLFVNSESRAETLRYYSILWRKRFCESLLFQNPSVYFKECPLYFDPSVDTAYITIESIAEFYQEDDHRPWFRSVMGSLRCPFRCLEIRDEEFILQGFCNNYETFTLFEDTMKILNGVEEIRFSVGNPQNRGPWNVSAPDFEESLKERQKVIEERITAEFARLNAKQAAAGFNYKYVVPRFSVREIGELSKKAVL